MCEEEELANFLFNGHPETLIEEFMSARLPWEVETDVQFSKSGIR